MVRAATERGLTWSNNALRYPQANEYDLWALFAPLGEILELYILRDNRCPNKSSRGCAFVTYASRALAEQAITLLNGHFLPNGKRLLVKLCDWALAGSQANGMQ
jgi:CUG-BP- and ETR3-like factor